MTIKPVPHNKAVGWEESEKIVYISDKMGRKRMLRDQHKGTMMPDFVTDEELKELREKARKWDNFLSGNCNICPVIDFCVTHDERPCEMVKDALAVKETT